MFADLTLQRSLAVNEAGDLARRRIKRLTEELSQLIKRVIKIEYEILAGQKGELEEEVKQEQQIIQTGGMHRADEIRADDEHVIWPFNGEYWRDELGYYRVKIVNKCGGQAPEGAPSTGESATPAAPAGGDTGGGAPARRRTWRRRRRVTSAAGALRRPKFHRRASQRSVVQLRIVEKQ